MQLTERVYFCVSVDCAEPQNVTQNIYYDFRYFFVKYLQGLLQNTGTLPLPSSYHIHIGTWRMCTMCRSFQDETGTLNIGNR